MSSQKSTSSMALAPKRQRGRLRVAAILKAATAVFAEKGYDGATMTEIAARSDTAIGSLYRFFPTKDILAEALLRRYRDLMTDGLDRIIARAASLPPAGLADAFVDLMLGLRTDRAAVIALIDADSAAADTRILLRGALLCGIARTLIAADATLPVEKAETMARFILLVLKSIPGFAAEDEISDKGLIAEARTMLWLYIAGAARA